MFKLRLVYASDMHQENVMVLFTGLLFFDCGANSLFSYSSLRFDSLLYLDQLLFLVMF